MKKVNMKRNYFFALFLVLFLLCGCIKTAPIKEQTDAPVQVEMPAPTQENPAPEKPAAPEEESSSQAALSGEEQAQLLHDLDLRIEIHPAHPALDMHWLDERASSQWLMFFQQQSNTYCPLLYGAAYEADLYPLEKIGNYLGALTFQDGSEPVYFNISIEDDTVTALPTAEGVQLLAAYESLLISGASESIHPESLPDFYYEMILTSIEIAYPAGLFFENPAELSDDALYTSFQLFANQADLLVCWDEQAGAYLFSEALIRSVLDRYYEGYTFHIEDVPQYDSAYQAISSQVVGGFGGGIHVGDLNLQEDGNRCTIRGTVRDGNGNPMCKKEYVLDFYDGGFHICAIRTCGEALSVAEPVRYQQIAQKEVVPDLLTSGNAESMEVLEVWSTAGIEVKYLAIPNPYQYLGNGVFYCYPDESHYGDGAYYRCDWLTGQPSVLTVQSVELITPVGQVRFRWWPQGTSLGIHNISDQQLQNDFSLQASLAYASALPDTNFKVLLTQGAGSGNVTLATLDLQTSNVEPLSTGATQAAQSISCNASFTRFLLRLEDGTFYLGNGQTAEPLAALTGAKSPIMQAYWRDFQSEDQIVFITQEQQERKSLWLYDCASGKTTPQLGHYLEDLGAPDGQTRYLPLGGTHALRRAADGTTALLELLTKTERPLVGFTWQAGTFWESGDDTALYLARDARGIETLGLLDYRSGIFQQMFRQPNPDQPEAFDLIHFDRRTIGIPVDSAEGQAACFLYIYRFLENT